MLEQKNKWHTTNDDVQTSHFTQLKMLPNDNVSMSVGHLDHVLIVYSLMDTDPSLQGKRQQCNSQVSHHRPCREREPCH